MATQTQAKRNRLASESREQLADDTRAALDAMNDAVLAGEQAQALLDASNLSGQPLDDATYDALMRIVVEGLRAHRTLRSVDMGIYRVNADGTVEASDTWRNTLVRASTAALLTRRIIDADKRIRTMQYLGTIVSPSEAKRIVDALTTVNADLDVINATVKAQRSLTRTLDATAGKIDSLSVTSEVEADVIGHVNANIDNEQARTGVGKALKQRRDTREERQRERDTTRKLLTLERDYPDKLTPTESEQLAALRLKYPRLTPYPKN